MSMYEIQYVVNASNTQQAWREYGTFYKNFIHSIKTDIINAGANWVDKEVSVDKGLVTSRTPADLAAFNQKFIEEIIEGKHAAH